MSKRRINHRGHKEHRGGDKRVFLMCKNTPLKLHSENKRTYFYHGGHGEHGGEF
jgi:hypothetical protein